MLDNVILGKDKSFETFKPSDGEALPKARFHKDLALDVEANVWYIYHHRNYNPNSTSGTTQYDVNKWNELS